MNLFKRIKPKRKELLAQLILVGILTVVFVIMGIHKQISFCDEMFTYDSANSDLPVGRSILNTEEWVTGNEIQNFLSASEISLDAYKMISYHLYKDHVPLYFWMFRTVSALLFSDSYTKWIGLVCNYPFYIGMGLLLYRFFSKRFGGGILLFMRASGHAASMHDRSGHHDTDVSNVFLYPPIFYAADKDELSKKSWLSYHDGHPAGGRSSDTLPFLDICNCIFRILLHWVGDKKKIYGNLLLCSDMYCRSFADHSILFIVAHLPFCRQRRNQHP